MPSHLRELALLSQLVAVSIILPAPALFVLGPYFLYMLSYAFLGWKWTAAYVAIDALVDLPQYVQQQTGAVAIAGASSGIVSSSFNADNPPTVYLVTHPYVTILLFIVSSGVLLLFAALWGRLAWRLVKRIRARVPWAT